MIDDYLETLARDARASGLESERLVDEAADHLRQAASAFEAMGYTRHEACMRAIADFGDPRTIVMSTSTNLGGFMRSKIRALALAIGVVATVTLWVGHVAPSQENTHTLFELMLVVLLLTIGWGWIALSVSVGSWAHQQAARLCALIATWLMASPADLHQDYPCNRLFGSSQCRPSTGTVWSLRDRVLSSGCCISSLCVHVLLGPTSNPGV
jgi:hypothetical protein